MSLCACVHEACGEVRRQEDDSVVLCSRGWLGFHVKRMARAVPFSGVHILVTETRNSQRDIWRRRWYCRFLVARAMMVCA